MAYSIDTWKSVPALVLASLATTAVLIRTSRRGAVRARRVPVSSRPFFLLLLAAMAASVFPSLLWTRSYDTVYQLVVRLACVAVAWCVAEVTSRPRRALWLGWVCGVASLVMGVAGVLEYFGLALWRLNTTWPGVSSLCNHPNLYAGALLLLVPPGLSAARGLPRWGRRAVMPALGLTALANIAATGSRAAMLAVSGTIGTSMVVMLVVRGRTAGLGLRRFLLSGLAAVALLAGFVALSPAAKDKLRSVDVAGEARWMPYGLALKMWSDSPRTVVFGNGLGSFVSLWPSLRRSDYRLETSDEGWDGVHCEYLEILVDGGVVELGLLVAAAVWLGLRLRSFLRGRCSPPARWLAVGFAVSIVAFAMDAVFSTNARSVFLLFLLSVNAGAVVGLCGSPRTAIARRTASPSGHRAVAAAAVAGFVAVAVCRLASDILLASATRASGAAQAMALSARAVELAPQNVYPWYVRARQALYAGEAEVFARAADETERRVPHFKDTVLMRGVFHLGRGEWADGMLELERHLAMDAYDLKARMYLLLAHLVAGDLDAAVSDLGGVLEADSRSLQGDSHDHPGSARTKYRVQASIVHGVDAIRVEWVGDTAHVSIGEVAARSMLTSLLGRSVSALNGYVYRLHYALGRVYDSAGAKPLVVRHLTEGREHFLAAGTGMSGEDESSYSDLLRILRATLLTLADESSAAGEIGQEIAYLQRYLAAGPSDEVLERLAEIHKRRGEWRRLRLLREQAALR